MFRLTQELPHRSLAQLGTGGSAVLASQGKEQASQIHTHKHMITENNFCFLPWHCINSFPNTSFMHTGNIMNSLIIQGGKTRGTATGRPASSRRDAKGRSRHQWRGPWLRGGGQGENQEPGFWFLTLLNFIHSIIAVHPSYLENVPEFCCYIAGWL